MVTFYPADLLDLCLCDRLFVRDNRKCLQHDICQCRFLGMQGKTDQTFVVFFFGAHLIGLLQFDDLDPSVFLLITVHHIVEKFSRCLLVLLDRTGDLRQLHGFSHGKKHRFDRRF